MKKILATVAILIVFLFVDENKAAAQNTFGYFDIDYVVTLMPGVGRVDTLLIVYEKDSLGYQYQVLVKEFNLYDSLLKVRDCGMRFTIDTVAKAAYFRCAYLLQNWVQYSQQALQAKQQELMQPYYLKVINAIQTVLAAEGKHTVAWGDSTSKLYIQIIKKLGLKVPGELLRQSKEQVVPHTLESPVRPQ